MSVLFLVKNEHHFVLLFNINSSIQQSKLSIHRITFPVYNVTITLKKKKFVYIIIILFAILIPISIITFHRCLSVHGIIHINKYHSNSPRWRQVAVVMRIWPPPPVIRHFLPGQTAPPLPLTAALSARPPTDCAPDPFAEKTDTITEQLLWYNTWGDRKGTHFMIVLHTRLFNIYYCVLNMKN